MPVVHVVVGPNGSGKTTLFERVIGPATHLDFINADVIARDTWPGDEEAHAYEASRRAAGERSRRMSERGSYATETVFSHPSKVELLREAKARGYLITLHVVMVPVELSVVRVGLRQQQGGHSVPEHKIRERFTRLWALLDEACELADETIVYDNSSARTPFRVVARYATGIVVQEALPPWSPWRRRGL